MKEITKARRFIKEMANVYDAQSKVESHTKKCCAIKRGRIKCVSSMLEDKFALYLGTYLIGHDPRFTVYVDYPISIKPGIVRYGKSTRKKCSFYPDIMICKEMRDKRIVAVYMANVKTSVGWFRDHIDEIGDEHAYYAEQMVGKPASFRRDDEADEMQKVSMTISKNCLNDIIVLSSCAPKTDNVEEQIRNFNKEHRAGMTQFIVLSPDNINPKYGDKHDINNRGWNMLYARVCRAIGRKEVKFSA